MLDLTPRSIFMFLAISLAWWIGAQELWHTLTNFATQWHWWVLATTFAVIITDVFFHVSLAHTTFRVDVRSITYKIFVLLSTIFNQMGRIKRMVMTHELHHLFPDQGDRDTLNVRRMWYGTVSLSPLMYVYQAPLKYDPEFYEQHMEQQRQRFQHVLEDPWTTFCDDHAEEILFVSWALLYLLAPVILFKIIFMGRFLVSVYHLWSGLGHVKLWFGYRNFNTPDQSYNHLPFHYIMLGLSPTMLQNNHHGMDFTRTHSHRWFEIDSGSWIMRHVLKPLMEQQQPR